MANVRSPDGAPPGARQAEGRGWDNRPPLRPTVPRSFQTRLTIAFMGVVALTLSLVAPVVVNRTDDYFRQQEEQRLHVRAKATAAVIGQFIQNQIGQDAVVLEMDGALKLNPEVRAMLVDGGLLTFAANNVAQADIRLEFGLAQPDTDGRPVPKPDKALGFDARLDVEPAPGQARDPAIPASRGELAVIHPVQDWGLVITLSNPYTSRASTLAAITGLLLVMASVAFLVAVLVATFLARRFTTPLTRLTEASRHLAEGDLSSRVPGEEVVSGTLELRELSQQFNTMADRLEESVAIIRRDRDRGRDLLADVSHELRTPIAAMRTFIELLQGPAGMDPAARTEFLDSSAVQLDRLDWLAQNLLELSKLDSGLVLLDLRPDDVRATIESAVEQHLPSAERKGIALGVHLPGRPLRISHDAPRIGQVVGNLVGNALKFSGRGGTVEVTALADGDGGARIEVVDTGVGIDASELPHIFDRFYRGSSANEARSAGSGLGLAIVKSIVDMHHGSIAVESRVGQGSRFVVHLPRDPRDVVDVQPPPPDAPATLPGSPGPAPAWGDPGPKMHDSSPIEPPPVNPAQAPLVTTPGRDDADPPRAERRPPQQ